jgi:phosphoribosylamine---glycine ligase
MSDEVSPGRAPRVLALGVGAFAQATMRVLRENGADVAGWLTRDYGHYGPRLEGSCEGPGGDICAALIRRPADLIVPMSIEWALRPWTPDFLALQPKLLCPMGEGLRIERERDFARMLCARFGVPFARAWSEPTRASAAARVRDVGRPMVIKNPLCSPTSPIHTIVCESVADTLAWLERLDDSEGVFLQEYLGRREAGHIALVVDGEVVPLVTNQEYKRAFDGNLGIVAGAPLGGLVEADPDDRHGLARDLIMPLRPWFREVGYRGPVQVTAMLADGEWRVLEYNVRLGVTSGPLILRMLANPVETLKACVEGRVPEPRWRAGLDYGCSITLAGYGYPFTRISGPRVPVLVDGTPDCDVWWQEVAEGPGGGVEATGHRIADVSATGPTVAEAVAKAYTNIRRLKSLSSYFRTDVGKSLWPPGED